MGGRTVSVAELRSECVNLERAIKHAGLATDAEIDLHRPGGEANPLKDARGFLIYYSKLHRLHARGEMRAADDAIMRADADVMAALRDEPIRIELVAPIIMEQGSGKERTVSTLTSLLVYQKSFDALLHAHSLDRQIAWLLIQKERIEEAGARGMPRSSELIEKCTECISFTYGCLAWIMTSPGPQMPYSASEAEDPPVPDHIRQLHPLDVAQIARASMQLHARLASVQMLLDPRSSKEGGKRPTWSSFYGSLAIELKSDSTQLSCNRSLGSLMASTQLHADLSRPSEESSAEAAS